MKAKLFKTGDQYLLRNLKGEVLAITDGSTKGRMLSLKNCQAIERGYDLDELADDFIRCPEDMRTLSEDREVNSFKKGFQKALELMGDKRFTEEDVEKSIIWAHDKSTEGVYLSRLPIKEFIQSIQQNEWEVEIEMETISSGRFIVVDYSENPPKTIIDDPLPSKEQRPKLDADGCLVLKRV